MPNFSININGDRKKVKVEEDTPLLWVIRDELELTGTKYGCGRVFAEHVLFILMV